MLLQMNKELRRIALLLVIAGMIMGLASPAACDEFYNNLLKLNGQLYEIGYVNSGITYDCITSGEKTAQSQHQPVVRRGADSRTDLFRLASGGQFCSSCTILIRQLSLLLLLSVTSVAALSYYHIIFIHLKDGHK